MTIHDKSYKYHGQHNIVLPTNTYMLFQTKISKLTENKYAGVSLSLAKTELNAYGFHRAASFRLNPVFLLLFVHISSSWVKISLHTDRY